MANTAKGIYYPGSYASVADVPRDLKEMAESIEKVIKNEAYDETQIQQDISELKQKNTEQDETIEELKAENTELKAENERLNNDINAISVTEQAEGENITLKDTAEARFKKFGIGGNSWQETREGYNLLQNNLTSQTANGITLIKQEDGTIIANGTATADSAFEVTKFNTEVQTYTLSGTPTTTKNTYNLCFGSSAYQDIGQGISRTFTEETEVSIYIRILSGQTLNNVIFKPMIIADTEVKEYEQYGTMPSPDYKSDIQNVTGNANVKIYNKNLIPDVFFKNDEKSKTLNGITATINADNTIKVSGTATARTILDFKNFNLKFKGKRNYQYISNSLSTDCRIEMYLKADGIDKYVNSYNGQPKSVKINSLLEIINPYIIVSEGQTVNTTLYFFLQEENSDTSYAEHQEQSFTIPVQQEMLEEDKFEKVDGVRKEKHTWGKITLTGDESFSTSDNKIYILELNYGIKVDIKWNNDLVNLKKYKCNNFAAKCFYINGKNKNEVLAVDNSFAINNTGYVIYFHKEGTTLEEFKALLKSKYEAGNPVVIYYKLKSGYYTYLDCTQEQNDVLNEIEKTAHSYGEQTHIFSLDEISLIFSVEARKDMNTVISNLESMIISNASEEV